MTTTPAKTLSPTEIDAFGRELDALREEVVADLGERDVEPHPRRDPRRELRRGGRPRCSFTSASTRHASSLGVAALGTAKILENMEIGHNVMHGQYDWTHDPDARFAALRVGQRLHRRRLAPLPQLRAPHLHQHARAGSRHRLRHPARERRAALAPGLPAAAALRGDARARVPVGRRRARPPHRRGAGREASLAELRQARATVPEEGRLAARQGLRILPRARALERAARARRQLPRERRSATCGRSPSSSAATSPTASASTGRGDGEREPRRVVPAPAQRLGEHRGRAALPPHDRPPEPPDRAPPVPRPAGVPLPRDGRRGCARSASATGSRYNTGSFAQQFGSVVARIFRYSLPPRAAVEVAG